MLAVGPVAYYNIPMVRKVLFVVLLLLAGVGLAAQEKSLAFNWAFVKRAPDGSSAAVNFSERVAIVAGDLFKIHLQPVQNAWLYLFLHDAAGDLELLFPERFEQFDETGYPGSRVFIPEGENWFTLDSAKGTERFYLFASSERLRALESLTQAWQKAASNAKATAAAKNAARQAVLDEMAALRKQHSQLAAAAEKPVTIAGGTRGINASVEKLATRIEAAGFYTRTFRLEH
jgi:hypothetical protein